MTTPVNLVAHLLDIYDFLPVSNRNHIVDPNFGQWVSTSIALTTTIAYSGPVMYQTSCGAGGVGTVARNSTAAWQLPTAMLTTANALILQQTTPSTGTVVGGTTSAILQHIEDARTLGGQSATFSCWLWCASGTVSVPNLVIRQNFGTSGSPSTPVVIDTPVNWVVTTTPQRFSVRVDLPTTYTKTFGTDGNDLLTVGIWIAPGQTFTLTTMQWQFERCSPQAPAAGMPTAFEYRGPQAELARVQRYYETGYVTMQGPGTGFMAVPISYKVTKRGLPLLNPLGSITYLNANTGTFNSSDVSAGYFSVNITSPSGYGNSYWYADARI